MTRLTSTRTRKIVRTGGLMTDWSVRSKSSVRTSRAFVTEPGTGASTANRLVSRRSRLFPAAAIALYLATAGRIPAARHRPVTVASPPREPRVEPGAEVLERGVGV